MIRRSALLVAAALGAALGAATCHAQKPPPEEQLQAIRPALIERALSSPTRVRSMGWLDEQGALHENTRVESNLTLRGVRVLSYLEEAGVLKAELAPGEVDSTAADVSCQTPASTLRRQTTLAARYTPSDGRLGYTFVPALAQSSRQTIEQRLGSGGGWLFSQPSAAQSSYERVLYESNLPPEPPYSLLLELNAQREEPMERNWLSSLIQAFEAPSNQLAPRAVRLSLRMEERHGRRVLWQRKAVIAYPAEDKSLTQRPLPEAFAREVEDHLIAWSDALQTQLRCEPTVLSATPAAAGLIRVNAGSRSGLAAGERLLLVDSTRVPIRTLEAESLQQTALLEIVTVERDEAQARIVAGTTPNGSPARWAALPL